MKIKFVVEFVGQNQLDWIPCTEHPSYNDAIDSFREGKRLSPGIPWRIMKYIEHRFVTDTYTPEDGYASTVL